jgi:hypothetical protein
MSKQANLFVRPLLAFKLLGTNLQLDPNRVYPAIQARNIPDWKEREAIWVEEILLEKGEYEKVKGYKPTQEEMDEFSRD